MTVLKNDALIVPKCWECVLPNTHTDMQASGSLKGQGATGRRRAVTHPCMSVIHTNTHTRTVSEFGASRSLNNHLKA